MTTVLRSIDTEKWLPVPGWEGCYEVSDHGRVRSLDRLISCSDGSVRRYAGRMMACPVDNRGRRAVSLKRQGHVVRRCVYTLVLEAFRGPRPPGFQGCHNDGDQLNDHLSNLRWDTSSENIRDQVRHGTHHMTRRTHCPSGHVLQEPNLAKSSYPNRKCKACHRAQATMANARRSGHAPGERQSIADYHYERIMREPRAC